MGRVYIGGNCLWLLCVTLNAHPRSFHTDKRVVRFLFLGTGWLPAGMSNHFRGFQTQLALLPDMLRPPVQLIFRGISGTYCENIGFGCEIPTPDSRPRYANSVKQHASSMTPLMDLMSVIEPSELRRLLHSDEEQ
jgi:hypothetical protein